MAVNTWKKTIPGLLGDRRAVWLFLLSAAVIALCLLLLLWLGSLSLVGSPFGMLSFWVRSSATFRHLTHANSTPSPGTTYSAPFSPILGPSFPRFLV